MHGRLEGQAFTIFMLTVAACEAGLALSLILSLYQRSKSLDVELWTQPARARHAAADGGQRIADEPAISLPAAHAVPAIDARRPAERRRCAAAKTAQSSITAMTRPSHSRSERS